jgi:hypothetical protein
MFIPAKESLGLKAPLKPGVVVHSYNPSKVGSQLEVSPGQKCKRLSEK